LKKLSQLFNDSDKEVNFRKDYYNLVQEQKKFSEFYTQFQRLFFYLDYQEKQLIVDLKNKINSWLWFAWVTQLIQLSTLKEIHFYLIRLNNDQRAIQEIKNREAMIKAKTTKQIIFVEESVKATRRIIETKMTDQSKSRDTVLTSVKENDLLIENCFLCHKSNHTSKECLNKSFRINALDDEFDHSSNFDSESDSKKLVISFKVIKEVEIISLCNLIDEISSIKENYFEKSFLVDVTLFSQDEFFKLRSLIDSDLMIYILIYTKLVNQICQKLEIQLIQLAK